MSRAFGRIEQRLESLSETQEKQWRKLDKIENYIITHKMWMAGIAGSVSLITTMVFYYFKKKIFVD